MKLNVCTSSGRKAKNKDKIVHPIGLCDDNFQVENNNRDSKIGRTGPRTLLKPAQPQPDKALISSCIAQHEELSSGSATAVILD